MSDYSQITFFTPKDGLATGNPNKIIYGSDVDAELSAISTAIATKADVDGDAIGAGTPATELSVDNLKLDANKIISTNTDGDIELEPNGAGYVVITNVDVAAGEIDGTTIGANSAAAGTFTTANATTVDTTNLEVTNLKAKDGTAAGSIADVTGVVTLASSVLTTTDINGGNIDGTIIGAATPAAGSFTTITASDDVNFDSGTFFVDASANAVGIGTTSFNSANKLEVTGDINTTWASGVSRFIGMRFGDGSLYEMGLVAKELPELQVYAKHASGAPITFLTGATPSERMRIDASGNVGIGTTSPFGKLDVRVADDATFQVVTNLTNGVSADLQFKIKTGVTQLGPSTSTPLAFATADTERMRIDSSGDMIMKGGRIKVRESDDGNDAVVITRDTDEGFVNLYSSGSQTVEIRGNGDSYFNGGNVGINEASPQFKLDVENVGGDAIRINAGNDFSGLRLTSTGGEWSVRTATSDALIFYDVTSATERARIDSNGILLINATAADGAGGAPGDINNAEIGKGYINLNRDDTATVRQIQFGKNGVVAGYIETGSSTTSYVTSSDARLKENIADAESASELIDAIKVRQFDWKADGSHQRYGMVAQELLEVAPEAVSQGATEDDMMGVDYSKLVPMLVKEIQSLRARVHALESK